MYLCDFVEISSRTRLTLGTLQAFGVLIEKTKRLLSENFMEELKVPPLERYHLILESE